MATMSPAAKAATDALSAAWRKDPEEAKRLQAAGAFRSPSAISASAQFDSQRKYTKPDAPVTGADFDADAYARNKAIQLFDSTNKYGTVADAEKAYKDAIGQMGLSPYEHYQKYGYAEGVNPTSGGGGSSGGGNGLLSGAFVSPNSMASNQAAQILAKDSPLLQQAETRANQYSNARGLLNSSIGNEAALSAVTGVAADLGKHQAEMYGRSQLSSQDYAQNYNLNAQQGNIASSLSSQNYNQTAILQKDLETMRSTFAQQLAEKGYEQQKINQMSTIIANQSNVLMSNIGNLLQNTDIEMGDNVTKWMSDFMYESWQTAASLFGLDIQVV